MFHLFLQELLKWLMRLTRENPLLIWDKNIKRQVLVKKERLYKKILTAQLKLLKLVSIIQIPKLNRFNTNHNLIMKKLKNKLSSKLNSLRKLLSKKKFKCPVKKSCQFNKSLNLNLKEVSQIMWLLNLNNKNLISTIKSKKKN